MVVMVAHRVELDRVRLFDERTRSRTSPRRYNEPMYSFLSTSGWPSIERVRDFWENWFRQYPDEKKAGLAARFRSHDHGHLSAMLELFTFAALKQSGCDLLVEPKAGDRSLEFLASRPGHSDFLVECTVTGQRASEASAKTRESDVIDAIDQIDARNFLVNVNVIQPGHRSPSLGRLKAKAQDWIDSLNSGAQSEGELLWDSDGWRVRLWADAIEGSDDDVGGMGMIGPRVYEPEQHRRLRGAIDKKASANGDLEQPLLVVVSSTEHQLERDLVTALVGDRLWTVNMETHQVNEIRKPNGIFHDGRRPRNTKLSAVMHGNVGATQFGGSDRQYYLVHHPFAEHPLTPGLFPFSEETTFDSRTGEPTTTPPCVSTVEFFGLPDRWPFYEEDPD